MNEPQSLINCNACSNARLSDNGLICVRYPPSVIVVPMPPPSPAGKNRVMADRFAPAPSPGFQLMVVFPVVNQMMLCREYKPGGPESPTA